MSDNARVAGWVDQLDDMAVHVTDRMLREGAGVQPPTVHVLIDGLDPAYVGYMTCRPFYRGRDAHAAVAAMGLLGSQLGATRLVVTYERADMAIAWEDPDADHAPTGIVVLDASHGEHAVRWHPVLMTEGKRGSGPAVQAEWGAPQRYPSAALPGAIEDLLAVWREPRDWTESEFLEIYARWEVGGYSMRWVQRPPMSKDSLRGCDSSPA